MGKREGSRDDTTLHASRIIRLEGAANVRDLGGIPTSDGRSVRRGRIFRSDVLYRLTETDTLTLRSYGIRTVIDLRSHHEVSHYPESSLKRANLQHFNVPIMTDAKMGLGNMAEDYLLLLRDAGAGFREIFGYLARDYDPLVINCFAGKDRTGLASALIQGALGVPDDVIAADYALSEQHMFHHMHIHRAPEDTTAGPRLLPSWLEANSATMESTLQAIAEEWGSVWGYLVSIGIPAEELRQISDALIE